MKRTLENRGRADMPSFLDDSPADTTVELDALDQASQVRDDLQDDESGQVAEGHEGFDGPAAEAVDELDYESEAEPAASPTPRRSTTAGSRSNRNAKPRAAGRSPLGLIGLVVATLAGIATQVAPVADLLVQRHLDPQMMLVVGLLLWAIGRSHRDVATTRMLIGELGQDIDAVDDQVGHALSQLQERSSAQDAANEPGNLEHVMMSLQKLDQKINNLTKAIKMYGKPLMDIANQGTDIAGGVAQVRVMVESGTESTRAGLQRLEDQVRKGQKQVDLGDLPDQVRQVGVSLAAVTQRLEDSEVRKSLVRLEDFAKELRQDVQVLQRGEPVQAAAEAMCTRLEEARQALAAGIQQLRDGNLGGLESSVRELLREVSGLATSTAQIQAAVKSGVRPGTPAASSSTPSPTTPAPGGAAPTPSPAAAAAPTAGDEGGASGYQTGKRTSGSKNVLGAIARLKQMKG